MIRLLVSLSNGRLNRLEMKGHIGIDHGGPGSNLVCAAVTGLVRSCAETIAANEQIESSGGAEHEGVFTLAVDAVPHGQRKWLLGVSEVLIQGLRRMQRDEPGEFDLRFELSE